MAKRTRQLLDDALSLPATERALLVEQLLASLDRSDPALDEQWAKEAEDRLTAFDAGEMKTMPADEVLADPDKR